MVACKMEAQLDSTHCIHIIARLVLICMLSRCLVTKFLHLSSVGSLLRVRCWLGSTVGELLVDAGNLYSEWFGKKCGKWHHTFMHSSRALILSASPPCESTVPYSEVCQLLWWNLRAERPRGSMFDRCAWKRGAISRISYQTNQRRSCQQCSMQ